MLTYPTTGFELYHDLDLIADNLKPLGTIYRAKFIAKNIDG